ncbi:sulfotransferase [Thalassotalea piscium]
MITPTVFPEKIFIIGLPRTGTTSVCAALLKLGFSVAHTAYTQQTFECAQVIADTPIFNDFILLDKKYPNARFIYLARELNLWLPSIAQLLQRMTKNLLRDDGGFNPIIKRCYLETFYPFTEDNIQSQAFLTQCYLTHQQKVTHYFKATPERLLSINISQDDAFEQLLSFLNIPAASGKFEKMNIGGKITAWKDLRHPLKISSTNKGRASRLDYLNK